MIKSKLHKDSGPQNEAQQISNAVVSICGRLPENVHIIYEPDDSRRIAFGGELIS